MQSTSAFLVQSWMNSKVYNIQKSRLKLQTAEIEHVEFVTMRELLLTSARLHNFITWLRIETLKKNQTSLPCPALLLIMRFNTLYLVNSYLAGYVHKELMKISLVPYIRRNFFQELLRRNDRRKTISWKRRLISAFFRLKFKFISHTF